MKCASAGSDLNFIESFDILFITCFFAMHCSLKYCIKIFLILITEVFGASLNIVHEVSTFPALP